LVLIADEVEGIAVAQVNGGIGFAIGAFVLSTTIMATSALRATSVAS